MRFQSKRKSIMSKLAVFLTAALALQCCFFLAFVVFGGTVAQLNQNAMDILNEQTINRKNYLENEMIQRWSNFDHTQVSLQRDIQLFLEEQGADHSSLTPENPITTALLEREYQLLIALLRRNSVTGVFIIFQGQGPAKRPAPGETLHKAGLYVRDMDPSSTPGDNSDLLVERGPSYLLRRTNLTMDINWNPTFLMVAEDNNFYNPIQAALENPGVATSDLGYWGRPFLLYGDDISVINYTQPLLDDDGVPYGVLGIELDVDYLCRQLPHAELTVEKDAGYLLVIGTDEERPWLDMESVVASGPLAKRVLGTAQGYRFEAEPIYPSIHRLDGDNQRTFGATYGSIQYLNIYNNYTPFEHQRWAVVGLMTESRLFSFSKSVVAGVLWLVLLLLVLGGILATVAGSVFTKPIRVLAEKVRNLDPNQPVQLSTVNILEIDELSASIERLSRDVTDSASRLSQIISMAGFPLSAFEHSGQAALVYYTKDFFPMLNRPEPAQCLTTDEFSCVLRELNQCKEEESTDGQTIIYKLPIEVGYRWLRLQLVKREDSTLGVLADVTKETVEKRRIEYERDYDLLTSLLNRRAFQSRLARLAASPETLHTSAMLMMDLDNLKYVNDSYGHDCGDAYIQCAADMLRGFTVYRGLAARISGDEFYLFLSGYSGRDELKEVVALLQARMSGSSIRLPDGQVYRLRASVGIAWYPDDSTSLTELIRFADFAMYQAKNAVKGSFKYFDIQSYHRDSFLLYSREELNRILDEGALDYSFQPIIDCATGGIMGYEALMRPRSKTLSTPLDVLRIARAQSKLMQIERLTWFRAMESFVALVDTAPDSLVFINSIPSLILSDEELARFDESFRPYLHRICIELTEGDELDGNATQIKQARCQEYQMHLAMDDFGTGYSNDSVLLSLHPDFVKVDMSIIRGIDQDRARQTLLRNLVSLCHELGVRIISEGVETEPELRTVVALGVDYIQGYYFCKPAIMPIPPPPETLAVLLDAYQAREPIV